MTDQLDRIETEMYLLIDAETGERVLTEWVAVRPKGSEGKPVIASVTGFDGKSLHVEAPATAIKSIAVPK